VKCDNTALYSSNHFNKKKRASRALLCPSIAYFGAFIYNTPRIANSLYLIHAGFIEYIA